MSTNQKSLFQVYPKIILGTSENRALHSEFHRVSVCIDESYGLLLTMQQRERQIPHPIVASALSRSFFTRLLYTDFCREIALAEHLRNLIGCPLKHRRHLCEWWRDAFSGVSWGGHTEAKPPEFGLASRFPPPLSYTRPITCHILRGYIVSPQVVTINYSKTVPCIYFESLPPPHLCWPQNSPATWKRHWMRSAVYYLEHAPKKSPLI